MILHLMFKVLIHFELAVNFMIFFYFCEKCHLNFDQNFFESAI